MPEVVVTCLDDGTVTVEAEGIKGTSCSLHTRPFIKALGVEIDNKPKQEMFQVEQKQKLKAKA